jgi:hypothetical protein
VHAFDPAFYGPVLAPLLAGDRLGAAGPGRPNASVRPVLAALSAESLRRGHEPVDADMAQCCLAGLWLLHDFLDESHAISQAVDTREGSYWHGIMHRRELDFSNAKYWFRAAGRHAIHEPLAEVARELAAAAESDSRGGFLARQRAWDAPRFVDLCQRVHGEESSAADLCRRVARAEWELLFDACYRAAFASF